MRERQERESRNRRAWIVVGGMVVVPIMLVVGLVLLQHTPSRPMPLGQSTPTPAVAPTTLAHVPCDVDAQGLESEFLPLCDTGFFRRIQVRGSEASKTTTMVFILSPEGFRRWHISQEEPFLKTARKVATAISDRRVTVSFWSADNTKATVGGCFRMTIGGPVVCKP